VFIATEVSYPHRRVRPALPLIVNLPWFVPTLGFFRDSERFILITASDTSGTLAEALARIRNGQRPAGLAPTELTKCIFRIAFAMAAAGHSLGSIARGGFCRLAMRL
jgi:hypothetical protein